MRNPGNLAKDMILNIASNLPTAVIEPRDDEPSRLQSNAQSMTRSDTNENERLTKAFKNKLPECDNEPDEPHRKVKKLNENSKTD